MKSHRRLALLITLLLSVFALALPAQSVQADPPTTLFVKPPPSGTNFAGCGDSWLSPCDLQTAIDRAKYGNYEIWVAKGTYTPTTGNDRAASFQLHNNVAIYGGFSDDNSAWKRDHRDFIDNVTILSGDIGTTGNKTDNSYHVVTASSGINSTAVLDGFTIEWGNANSETGIDDVNGWGGGIYIAGGSPKLANITFNNNSGIKGGGIYNGGGRPELTNTTFDSNFARYGGGIFNAENSEPKLTDVTFTENLANNHGGGLYNLANSKPELTRVTFSNNSTGLYGGGMYNSQCSPILDDVTFDANYAEKGGGMYNDGSSPELTDVTFLGNSGKLYGGGMYNANQSSPTLTNVTFDSNSTDEKKLAEDHGGGMYNDFSDPVLNHVTFTHNMADFGGGLYNTNGSAPNVTNVTFTRNSSFYGGGMYNSSSSPTLTDVAFSENWAYYEGGGVYNTQSSPTLTNVTFSGNNTGEGGGGGMANEQSCPTLTNVTFSGNSAAYGGGMSNKYCDVCIDGLVLTNVTISGNSATNGGGGGIYNENGYPTLLNSIVWGNTATFLNQQIDNVYASVSTINYSVVQGGCPINSTCSNIIEADPLLGELGDYGGFTPTVPLLSGSPAIDAGSDTGCPATDQRGVKRPQGFHCDIGAYEVIINFGFLPLVVR